MVKAVMLEAYKLIEAFAAAYVYTVAAFTAVLAEQHRARVDLHCRETFFNRPRLLTNKVRECKSFLIVMTF